MAQKGENVECLMLGEFVDDASRGGENRVEPPLLTESVMARDTARMLLEVGLPHTWRIQVDKPLAAECDPIANTCGLPLYCDATPDCQTDSAREMARADMLVIDTARKLVQVIFEFELDTNPKNLLGNVTSPLLATSYRDPRDNQVYRLSPDCTKVFLVACLKRSRSSFPRDMAAVQKGQLVAKWIEAALNAMLPHTEPRTVQKVYARAHHDWQRLLVNMREWWKEGIDSPNLSAQ